MHDIISLSLTDLQAKLADGEVTATAAAKACLERIQATEPALGALLHVRGDEALAEAKALDAAGHDPQRPLWGVPVTIKDVIATKGTPTTCASKILENFVPFYDAHLVDRLKEAGAVILGKTNMDEFAMGSTTETSAYKTTSNPWDTDRVPGGSSGGSAASVAAGQCFASVGTDTGGSIRQPASFCGCVGLKPTYGRISRYGLIAYGSSLDQAGPLARTARDAAAMLQAMAGHDPKDSTSAPKPVPDYLAALDAMAAKGDLSGVTLGLPAEFWGEGCSEEVTETLRAAVAKAEALGAKTVEVSLPHTRYAVATYYIVAMAEASSNLARFDGVRYGHRDKTAAELVDMYVNSRSQGFGDEVQRRIMIGTYVLSAGYYDAYYRKAAQIRRLIREDFLQAFTKCDMVVGPASPVVAWKLGEIADDPMTMYLMDIFTISLNLAGLPGLSFPAGLGAASGMPVGLQCIGPAFAEDRLLALANLLEEPARPEL